jgi:hypothetical protein
MAAPPIGSIPPQPLKVSWLVAYAGLSDADAEDLERSVVEEACIVKRGDQWTSKFVVTDQHYEEREYRFYTELAAISAQAELASMERAAQSMVEDDSGEFTPSESFSSTSTSRLWRPQKRSDPAIRPGVVPDRSSVEAHGIEGCYEVIRPRVSIHCSPSSRASLLGVLHRQTIVRGLAFAAADGEPWLLLHEDAIEDAKLRSEAAFVPISMKGLGCGDLLKRLPGRPAPGRHAWRQSTKKETKIENQAIGVTFQPGELGIDAKWESGRVTYVEDGSQGQQQGIKAGMCFETVDNMPYTLALLNDRKAASGNYHVTFKISGEQEFKQWKQITLRLLARALRLPRCLAASWKGVPETLCLVVERLDPPGWMRADLAHGCSIDQAGAAIDALAGFHNAFADDRKLTGAQWLPDTSLGEAIGQVEKAFGECFTEHRQLLVECTPPRAFAVLDKFRHHYARLVQQLAQPPLTLLHGNFHPGCLRFSASSSQPIVAAYDWQNVCRGRGAYDFAMFLGCFASVQVRHDCEMELMMRYLMARGLSGRDAREAFKSEVRAGLLVAFAFFFLRVSGKLAAEPTVEAKEKIMESIERFTMAIEEWDCAESVGGVGVAKSQPKKRKYLKKSKRRVPAKSPAKAQEPETEKKGRLPSKKVW